MMLISYLLLGLMIGIAVLGGLLLWGIYLLGKEDREDNSGHP